MKTYSFLLAILAVIFCNPIFAQPDSVYITPNQTVVGEQVRVDFPVQQFEKIACLQYTMNYDPTILEFESIGNLNLPDLDEGNFNATNPGLIAFSWIDQTVLGVDKMDSESIYSVFFKMTGNGNSELFIDGSMIPVEACVVSVDPPSVYVIPLVFQNITIAAFSTSNKDIENEIAVDVYPNPASEQVTFDVGKNQTDLQLSLYDNIGKLIHSQTINNQQNTIQRSAIGSGMYFYKIQSGDQLVATGRFSFL